MRSRLPSRRSPSSKRTSPRRGRWPGAGRMAALELLIDYGVERAREICEAEEELEAPKTAVDGLARFAGEQGRKLFTLPPVAAAA